MQEKMSIEQFQHIKNQCIRAQKDAENYYSLHEKDENFDVDAYEKRFFEEYSKIYEQLLQFDLSDIPFEAWKDMYIVSTENHVVDFSRTKANIDFEIVDYFGNGNFKGCNVKNISHVSNYFSSTLFDDETIKANSSVFLSDSFTEEFKSKFYLKNIDIEDYASLSDMQLEEIKQNALFESQYINYLNRTIYSILGLDKSMQLYRYSSTEYNAVRDIFLSIYTERKNFDYNRLEEFLKQVKQTNIEEIKKVCFDFVRNEILNSDIIINPSDYKKSFIDENPDIFLTNVNIPSDVKRRFFNKELDVEDLLKYPEVFNNIQIDYFMKDEIFKFIRGEYGIGKIQEFLQKHSDVFKYMSEHQYLNKFVPYLRQIKYNSLGDLDPWLEGFPGSEGFPFGQDKDYDGLFFPDGNTDLTSSFDLDNPFGTSDFDFDINNPFTEFGIKIDLDSLFAQAVKRFIFHYGVAENEIKNHQIPDWLSSMNFKLVDGINTYEELSHYNSNTIVLNNKQRDFIDTLGIDNIIRFEQETGLFTSFNFFGADLIFFHNLCDSFDKNTEIGRMFNNGNLSYDEFLDVFANLLGYMRKENVFSPDIITNVPNYDCIKGKFREDHPEIFIDQNAPAELKEAFYNNFITPEFLHQHKDYIKYLLDKNMEDVINVEVKLILPGLIDEEGNIVPSFSDFVNKYVSRYGNEKFLELCVKYGDCLSNISVSSLNNEINDERTIEKSIREAIYNKILNKHICYPQLIDNIDFKIEHPDLFISDNAPPELIEAFYNQKLTTRMFDENPNYINYFNNTNIALGFPYDNWIANIFNDRESMIEAQLLRLKLITVCQSIDNIRIEAKFKDYIENNHEYITGDKIDMLAQLITRIEYSNSEEIKSFGDSIFTLLLDSQDPIGNLGKIEDIFLRNNLPLCGKMFLCFQILYPKLSDVQLEGGWESDLNLMKQVECRLN